MKRAWTDAGHKVEVPGQIDRLPAYDPRSGEHLWIVGVVYRVDPAKFRDPTATPILDNENLLLVPPPGCFWCEQSYTELLATRRCKGEPRHG